jgi:ferredoxin
MTSAEMNESQLAERIRAAVGALPVIRGPVRERFAARLAEVAANREQVPIELADRRLEARLGGTVLATALKNGVRLMHVCGARTLCGTCRVRVDAGGDNLTPMTAKERLSLRYHLSFSSRTRLACQARVLGPIEAEPVMPLCGDLPAAR